ncbi:MAG TPA: glycosyltransferase family 39 protein [Desulfomonilaceae bacterium]|nr:glycosyltransferase family 39 protein [Desulfomonilaceae bacterium]
MGIESHAFRQIANAVQGVYTARRGLALALVTVLGFCLIVNSSWHATPDSALYLELGESLARGDGYQFNGEPHTYVPPGYPALVAAVAYFFGRDFLAYRVLMAVMGLLTAGAGYLLILRLCGSDAALIVGGLFAVNHVLLQNSTYTTSDVPFALFSLLALHATLSAASCGRVAFWTILGGLMVGLPPLFRINGWGLPPVAAFFLFQSDTDRPLRSRAVVAGLFLLLSLAPSLVWEFHKSTFPISSHEGTYFTALTGRTIEAHVWIILKSAWEYVQESSYALTGVSMKTGILELICPVLAIIGMARAWAGGDRLLVPLTIVQFFGLLLSPAGSRYLILLIPGLYLFLGLGLISLFATLAGRRGIPAQKFAGSRPLLLGCFALLAALNVGHNVITVFHARMPLESGGAQSARDLPFFAAARWLKTQPSDTVILTMHPRVLHYLSGRPTWELVRSGVPEHQALIEDQDQIRDIVLSRKPAFLFSDKADPARFKKTIEAIESLGLRLEEVPEATAVLSNRFCLWRICPGPGCP